MTNSKTKPIRRAEYLKQLSRDHHHGLLLGWKIRQGIQKKIAPDRIHNYVKWFFESYLQNHFEIEEKLVYPILGASDSNIKKAIDEHKCMKELVFGDGDLLSRMVRLSFDMEGHIRFEERILFNLIQQKATEEDISQLLALDIQEPFIENTDQFWIQ